MLKLIEGFAFVHQLDHEVGDVDSRNDLVPKERSFHSVGKAVNSRGFLRVDEGGRAHNHPGKALILK